MTANAVFCDALGNLASIDDLDHFLGLFDHPDPDLWIGETGELSIWRAAENGREQALVICYVSTNGFTFHSLDDDNQIMVACIGNNSEPVAYEVAGKITKRPKRAFLNLVTAKTVAAQFIDNGTLSAQVYWVSIFDLWPSS